MNQTIIKFNKKRKHMFIMTIFGMLIPLASITFISIILILSVLKGKISILLFIPFEIVTLSTIIFIIAFLPNTLFKLKKMILGKPAIILDDKGIKDLSSLWTFGFIPWREIKTIDSFRAGLQGSSGFIAIEPKDIDSLISKQSFITKLILKLDILHYGDVVVIHTQPLVGHFTPVVDKVKSAWKKNLTK